MPYNVTARAGIAQFRIEGVGLFGGEVADKIQ